MKYLTSYLLIALPLVLKGQSISVSDLESLGNQVEDAVILNDTEYLNKVFDMEAFLDMIIEEASTNDIKQYNDGFVKGFTGSFQYGNMIVSETVGQGSDYSFLRAYEKDGEGHLIFRLFGEVGLNYHDYKVVLENNELRITDMYIYLTGEHLSKTLKRLYLLSGAELFKTFKAGELPLEDLQAVSKSKQFLEAGNYKSALEALTSVSETLRQEKIYGVFELNIRSHLEDGEAYLEAMKRYQEKFPNDPSVNLISIDYFILKEDYTGALTAVNELGRKVGGDDFLSLFRGNIHYANKKVNLAAQEFESLTRKFPEFVDGWDSLLSLRIELGEYHKAVEVLDKILANLEMDLKVFKELLESEPGYSDFIKSQEYKDWKAKN